MKGVSRILASSKPYAPIPPKDDILYRIPIDKRTSSSES